MVCTLLSSEHQLAITRLLTQFRRSGNRDRRTAPVEAQRRGAGGVPLSDPLNNNRGGQATLATYRASDRPGAYSWFWPENSTPEASK